MSTIKTLCKAVFVIIIFITAVSFTNNKYNFIGTYGVSDDDPAQIKLTLMEDHAFTYRDFSNPQKKIDVKGTWKQDGKMVILNANDSRVNFHNKWKFLKNGQVAKSRKGVTFYSLCKL